MIVSIYVLLPAIETHVVLTAMIPVAAAAAGDDVDGASGGIVDGEIGGCLAVNEYGAGVVEELMGAVWVAAALKLGVELIERNHFCERRVSDGSQALRSDRYFRTHDNDKELCLILFKQDLQGSGVADGVLMFAKESLM